MATGVSARPGMDRARASIATGRGSLTPIRVVALIGLLLIVLLAGASSSSATRYSLIIATVYGLVIVGNNAVTAVLGEINLGAGASLALGAYATAYFMGHGDSVLVAGVKSVLITSVVGAILAIGFIRLSGIFTALGTFALVFALPSLIVYLDGVTGGANGTPVPIDPEVLGLTVGGSNVGMLVLALVAFAVFGTLAQWLLNSRVGQVYLLIGEAPAAAVAFGYRVGVAKILVWAWAALVGAVGGVLFALTVGYVSPTQFDPFLSISLLVGGIVGGLRSSYGAWLGGALVGFLPSQLQDYVPASATGLVYGLTLLAVLALGSRGIAELLERLVWLAMARTRGADR